MLALFYKWRAERTELSDLPRATQEAERWKAERNYPRLMLIPLVLKLEADLHFNMIGDIREQGENVEIFKSARLCFPDEKTQSQSSDVTSLTKINLFVHSFICSFEEYSFEHVSHDKHA